MKKIAIISDIHGNIPALESVLEDIKKRNIDSIFCLGDLAGKGPSAAEAVDLVKDSL
ncbi:MAG: metallophosphoesterase [bacterium]|nr:metallophosphoesterase [bacterium]